MRAWSPIRHPGASGLLLSAVAENPASTFGGSPDEIREPRPYGCEKQACKGAWHRLSYASDGEEEMSDERLEGRAYWLAHCEGYRVDAPGGRLGRVETVISRDGGSRADALVVRGGLLGGRLVVVPVDEVDRIVPRKERIALRASPELAGTEFLPEILARARRSDSIAA
jgi:hypothetical protein